ncbi:MAG: 7-cyano-7-deazaguanine synthase [Candidatus Omnitrophica bacterium]|nr:7-cyano-7-deazaguanine synthase [Candidatus Omnitrophota bacterium]
MTIETRTICKRCVLPESRPDVWLDAEGVCNICRTYDQQKDGRSRTKLLESDFVKILSQHKSKGKYDCLVMCSGGKDSTAALYYMKKRYKLNPLAFTFDHGFETEGALENIRNAVEILGIDFLFFKSDFMKEMFLEIVKTDEKVALCHPCSIWYMGLTFEMAARYDIPLIVAGWTRGQVSQQPLASRCADKVHGSEFISMSGATQAFLDKYTRQNPKYKDFPKSMEEVVRLAGKRHKATVVSPHWFLPTDSGEYVELLQKELKWKFPPQSYPGASTNCSLNFLSVHNAMRHFGYTHYHVEMSKMIRESLLSRQEALKLLEINFGDEVLRDVMQKLSRAGGK